MSSEEQQDYVTIPHQEALAFSARLLEAYGVSATDAATVADNLVSADLRGVDSHGINRLPSYVARIRQGVLDAQAQPTVRQVTPVVAHVDGHNALGAVVAQQAMRAAIVMASGPCGLGLVACQRSNHFGMSAWVVQQALEAGLVSLVFTNSSPALPAWGGRTPLLGVSPLACGAPSAGPVPFVLDMAPSVAARGKVYKALRRGERIPEGWALDGHGRPTTDPAQVVGRHDEGGHQGQGTMLPMGGPKGSGLAVMMDVFSGVLSGAAYAGHVAGPYDASRPGDVGHFLVVMKPDLFVTADEFRDRMRYLYERVVGADRMAGVDRIYFPGEKEFLTREDRLVNGIPYARTEVETLNREAVAVGVAPLVVT